MFQVLQLKDNRVDKLTYLEMFSGFSFGLKMTFATCQSSSTHLWVVKDDFRESFSDDNHKKKPFRIRKSPGTWQSHRRTEARRPNTGCLHQSRRQRRDLNCSPQSPKHGPEHLIYRCRHQECPPFFKARIKGIASRHVSWHWKNVRNRLWIQIQMTIQSFLMEKNDPTTVHFPLNTHRQRGMMN